MSINLLKDHFIEGSGFDFESQTVVRLKAEDLGNLPHNFMERAVSFLVSAGGQTPS
jgi:hypothetical protein